MKKIRLIVCSAIAALLLAGCSGKKAGQLPSGGKKVDVTTEAGQETIKNEVQKLAKAYAETEFTALGAKLQVKNTSASVKGNAEEVELDCSLKKFQATAEAKLGNNQLEAHIKDVGGEAAVKLHIPQDDDKAIDLDDSVKFSKVGADGYVLDGKLYVDYSGKGLRNLLNDASPIITKVINQPGVKIDANDFIDNLTKIESRKAYIEVPEFEVKPSDISSLLKFEVPSEEEWNDIFKVMEDAGDMLEVRTYSDGRFGVALNVTKDKLVALAEKEGGEKEMFDMFEKLDVKVAVVINKDGLLTSASAAGDVQFTIEEKPYDEGDLGTKLDIAIKAEVFLDITYNDDVKFNFPKEAELEKFEKLDLSKISL